MIERFSDSFPKVFARYGSQFDVDDSGIPNEEILKLVKDQVVQMFHVVAQSYKMATPDFEFTQGPERGAFAAVNDGVQVVGISLPLAQGIIAYFNSAMTRHNSYTEQMGITYNSVAIADWWEASSYSHFEVPSKPELVALAQDLSRFALLYIAGHELGHIFLGHLGKKSENHWSSDFTEDSNSFDQFCREVAADRFAAHFLFNYINNIKDGQNNKLLYQLTTLSVVSLFMYEKPRKDWALMVEAFGENHPPAQFRALIGQTSLGMTVPAEDFLDPFAALQITGSSFEVALRIHESITGRRRTREEGLQYARLLPKMDEIISQLFKRHRELYPAAGL